MVVTTLFIGALISFIIGIVSEHSFLAGMVYAGMFEVIFTGLFIFTDMIKDSKLWK